MGVLEDLADALARDTIAASNEMGDDGLIMEVAKQLGATSTTMEEAYLTAIRVRLSEQRGRQFLERRIKAAQGDSDEDASGVEFPSMDLDELSELFDLNEGKDKGG